RRDRGGTAALPGAAQNHFALAHGLREIMRRLANFALRRRQSQGGAHGPVEKSVGARLRRPYGLVEAAKQKNVGVDEARFEKPEDLEAGMRPLASAQDDFARHRREKKPVGLDVENHAIRVVLRQLIKEGIERFAILAILFSAGDCLDGLPVRRNPTVQGDLSTHIQKRRELGAEANQKIVQIVPIFFGNPLLGGMRKTAAYFLARSRE